MDTEKGGKGSFEAKGTPFLDVKIDIKYLGDWPPPRGDVAKGTLEGNLGGDRGVSQCLSEVRK